MSTVPYKIINQPTIKTAPHDWKNDPFYTKAIVLGIDIGIEGIGLWLRKGPKPIFAQTFLVSLPASAPLKNRRQKRAHGTRAKVVNDGSGCFKNGLSGMDCLRRSD